MTGLDDIRGGVGSGTDPIRDQATFPHKPACSFMEVATALLRLFLRVSG
jgi:hypothetical protein